MYINNNIFNFKNKKLILVLNKIYGINTEQAKYILKNLGINTNISVNDLTQPLLKQINEFLIKKNYIINFIGFLFVKLLKLVISKLILKL